MSGRIHSQGKYSWDRYKDQGNVDKHGYTFHQAQYAFARGTPKITVPARTQDPGDGGWRCETYCQLSGRIVKVVHVETPKERRIISMRHLLRPNRRDRQMLEKFHAQHGANPREQRSPQQDKELRAWQRLADRQRQRNAPATLKRLAQENRLREQVRKTELAKGRSPDGANRMAQNAVNAHQSQNLQKMDKHRIPQEKERLQERDRQKAARKREALKEKQKLSADQSKKLAKRQSPSATQSRAGAQSSPGQSPKAAIASKAVKTRKTVSLTKPPSRKI